MVDQHSAQIISLDLDNHSHPRYGALGIIQYGFDSMRGTFVTFFPVNDFDLPPGCPRDAFGGYEVPANDLLILTNSVGAVWRGTYCFNQEDL